MTLLTTAIAIFTRRADGSLRQLNGRAGCIASARLDDCRIDKTLAPIEDKLSVLSYFRNLASLPATISVSPDGRNVEVGGADLVTFRRNPSTGELRRVSCISSVHRSGCTRIPLHLELDAPVFRPDGRRAYTRGYFPGLGTAIVALRRDRATGALTLLHGSRRCLSADRFLGCRHDRRLRQPVALTITPDGRDLYVASKLNDAYGAPPSAPSTVAGLHVHDSGALSIASNACISRLGMPHCITDFGAVAFPISLATSPNGRVIYAATANGVTALSRDAPHGTIHAASRAVIYGTDLEPGSDTPSEYVDAPIQLLTSPGGHNIYAIADGGIHTLRTNR